MSVVLYVIALLLFTTDYYCNNGIPKLLTNVGSVNSPKYPSDYPVKVVCRWIIRIPQNIIEHKKFIKLTFEAFNLEFHSSCVYDSLVIYDGEEGNKTLLGSFCGDDLPSPLYASKGQMVIKFTSDETMVARGFNATFNFTSLLG